MNPEELLNIATDYNTMPDVLTNIYNTEKGKDTKDTEIIEAIALNPNSSTETLKKIFQNEPGMADKIFNENDVFGYLMIEDPNLINDWIKENPQTLYVTNDNKSPALYEIGYNTQDEKVLLALAKSRNTSEDIVGKIEDKIIKKVDETQVAGWRNKNLAVSLLENNDKVSDKFAAHIQDNANGYGWDTFAALYARLKDDPQLSQKIDEYRIDNSVQNIENQNKELYDSYQAIVPKVEKIVEVQEFIEGLQAKQNPSEINPDEKGYILNPIAVDTSYNGTNLALVSSNGITLFAYEQDTKKVAFVEIDNNVQTYTQKIVDSSEKASNFLDDYAATSNPETDGATLTRIYDTYTEKYEKLAYFEEMSANIASNPNAEIDTLKKIFQENERPGIVSQVLANPVTQNAILNDPNTIENWVETANNRFFFNPIPVEIQQVALDSNNEQTLNYLADSDYTDSSIISTLTQNEDVGIVRDAIRNKNVNVSDLVDIINNDNATNVIKSSAMDRITSSEELSQQYDQLQKQNNPDTVDFRNWSNELYSTVSTIHENAEHQCRINFIPETRDKIIDGGDYQIKVEQAYIDWAELPDDPTIDRYEIVDKQSRVTIAALANDITIFNKMSDVDIAKWENIKQDISLFARPQTINIARDTPTQVHSTPEQLEWAASIAPAAEKLVALSKDSGKAIIDPENATITAIGSKYKVKIDALENRTTISPVDSREPIAVIDRDTKQATFARPTTEDRQNWNDIKAKLDSEQARKEPVAATPIKKGLEV